MAARRADVDKTGALPAGVFEAALAARLEAEARRILRLDDGTRAPFAAAVVAELLAGATASRAAGDGWAIAWKPGKRQIRVEVAVLGERRSREQPGERPAHALVVARHRGDDVTSGWGFHVLGRKDAKRLGRKRLTKQRLRKLGIGRTDPSALAAAVRDAARR